MEIPVGRVIHYSEQENKALVKINRSLVEPLKVGDVILICGETTEIAQRIFSMEINKQPVHFTEPGKEVLIRTAEPVVCGDEVYKMVEESNNSEDQILWSLAQEAHRAIIACYSPVFERFINICELSESTFGLLLAALTFEPDPISPSLLQVRGPFTAASVYQERLNSAAQRGFLRETGQGEFSLTEKGHAELKQVIAETRTVMAQADPLPKTFSSHLAHMLDWVVQACLNAPPPPDHWAIRLSYKLMPTSNPPLPFIEQALSCLMSYRDDSHLAAWRPSELSPTALEELTLLWKGEAESLEDLGKKLARRGHSPIFLSDALSELRETNFVTGTDEALRLTRGGLSFRTQVENDTNAYFFAPWICLSKDERAELANLLSRLKDGLKGS